MKQWGHVDADRLVTLYQVHSADVVIVDDAWNYSQQIKADGMVSTTPGVALGILTADCTPVLFADEKNQVIGAAHAGWGGALKGITLNVIRTMIEQGAEEEQIAVAIGPTIRQSSYEVGEEFRERFLEQAEENHQFFLPSEQEQHYQFNLPAYIKHQLVSQTNVKHITDIGLDTYSDESEFFSYRRTCHREEGDYGRNLSAIILRK
jgi:hypothetical protein